MEIITGGVTAAKGFKAAATAASDRRAVALGTPVCGACYGKIPNKSHLPCWQSSTKAVMAHQQSQNTGVV